MFLERVTLLLCLAMLANTVLNSFLLHKVGDSPVNSGISIGVLSPLRNEEKNVFELLTCLKSQNGLKDIEFYLVDDNSTDSTASLLTENTKSDFRFSIISGESLPPGWLGKPFALQQAFFRTNAEVIILVDADVKLSPNAISQAITMMFNRKLDFMSCYPKQIAQTWSERVVQPLLQWSWIATVPLRIAERSLNPALAVANGQFFLVKRDALQKIGGFQCVKNEVLDDIFLARSLLKSGFRGAVVDGSSVASCRMYESWKEIKAGYGKSLRKAFGGIAGSAIAITFLFMTGIFPIVQIFFGSLMGAISCSAVLLTRLISAHLTKSRPSDVVFHPLSVLLLIYLILYSWTAHKKITWKGRAL